MELGAKRPNSRNRLSDEFFGAGVRHRGLEVRDCFLSDAACSLKITRMIKAGELIRVKRGLYLFGTDYQKKAPSSLHSCQSIPDRSTVS